MATYTKGGFKGKKKYQNDEEELIDCDFDITTLDTFLQYLLTDNTAIHRGHYLNMKHLFDNLNMQKYQNDQERLAKIDLIRKALDARVIKNLINRENVISDISGVDGLGAGIIVDPMMPTDLIKWVDDSVSQILKYNDMINAIPIVQSAIDSVKGADYRDKYVELKKFENAITTTQNIFRAHHAKTEEDIAFSLQPEEFRNSITEAWTQTHSVNNSLKFNTKALNMLTGGGLQKKRVYTILGLPGEGKSTTLLEFGLQIKKANANYKPADPSKRPCIVLLIMENDVTESIERLYSMCCPGEQLKNCKTPDEAIYKLHQVINIETDPIDLIIRYKPNLSVSTDYLYTLYDDLYDQGYEMMCLIQDYLKRIRSTKNYRDDLRRELGEVVNEFKTFANVKNIPVVTASQLNRDATSKIDSARANNKSDLVRILGRSNVGESNLILENSDWIVIIAPEIEESTQIKYLGINRVKSRYKIDGIYKAYIPYVSGSIKFVEDNLLPGYCHKDTLSDEYTSMNSLSVSSRPNTAVASDGTRMIAENNENNLFLKQINTTPKMAAYSIRKDLFIRPIYIEPITMI